LLLRMGLLALCLGRWIIAAALHAPSRRSLTAGVVLALVIIGAGAPMPCVGVVSVSAAVTPANILAPLPASPAPTEILIGRCYDLEPTGERPTRLLYGCDGTGVLENMTWTAWGPDGADGTGLSTQTQCVPNCAAGRRNT